MLLIPNIVGTGIEGLWKISSLFRGEIILVFDDL